MGPVEPVADCYAILGEPRLPWVDPGLLKAKFHRLSAAIHPDRVHGAGTEERTAATHGFAELNRAYACLREPKSRLAHLLRLELGAPPPNLQRIPPGTIELFNEVGATTRTADSLLAEREVEPSPMRRVQLFERGVGCMERVESLLRRLAEWDAALLAELHTLNAAWDHAPPPDDPRRQEMLPLGRLGEIAQLLGYLARWKAQLEERQVRLGL